MVNHKRNGHYVTMGMNILLHFFYPVLTRVSLAFKFRRDNNIIYSEICEFNENYF